MLESPAVESRWQSAEGTQQVNAARQGEENRKRKAGSRIH
jgi:hypothetical protein